MSALDRTDYSLSGILPVVPRFDFVDMAMVEAPAQWEVMAAILDYEEHIRPIAHDWSVRRGRELWELRKPWFCSL